MKSNVYAKITSVDILACCYHENCREGFL